MHESLCRPVWLVPDLFGGKTKWPNTLYLFVLAEGEDNSHTTIMISLLNFL